MIDKRLNQEVNLHKYSFIVNQNLLKYTMQKEEGTPPIKATQAEKYATVLALVQQQERLLFADGTTPPERVALTKAFVNGLVSILEAHKDSRQNSASEFLFGASPVMLHASKAEQSTAIAEQQEDGSPILHIYLGLNDNLKTQLHAALDKARDIEPKAYQEQIVAEVDPSQKPTGKYEKQNRPNFDESRGRDLYDPKAKSIKENGIKKHTSRDLKIYGQMRMGKHNLSDKQLQAFSQSFEDNKNISQQHYEKILGSAGGRFIWEKLHEYLLDEETLKEKKPHRWFRDMCVLCGISTTMLGNMIGHNQGRWSGIQNKAPGNNKHTVKHHIRTALEHMIDMPITAGRNGCYKITEGSIFDLPTIHTQSDKQGHEIANPAFIESILKPLYGNEYTSPDYETKILKHLQQLSNAYMSGAIRPEELQEFPKQLIRQIFSHNPKPGLAVNKKECTYITDTLESLNKKKWHLPEKEFTQITQAFQKLPSKKHLNRADGGLTKDEAFEFAKRHHTGSINNFLTIYRKATHKTLDELAQLAGVTYRVLGQYEQGERSDASLLARALSFDQYHKPKYRKDTTGTLENLWQLPEDQHGNIREDVTEYLNHFDTYKHLVGHDQHWLNISNALEQIGGVDFEAEYLAGREVVGNYTGALFDAEASQNHGAVQQLSIALNKQLAKRPYEPFPFITLSNGADVLMKRDDGEVKLLDTDLPKWRDALLNEIHQEQRKGRSAER